MNTKRKLLFSFVGLILSIAIFSTVVFAWFAISNATADVTIETGNVNSKIELYAGKWNKSSEEYDWSLVDTNNKLSRIFEDMVPGQILTFRLDVINEEDSEVNVTYNLELGMLLYCSDIKVDNHQYTEQKEAIGEDSQHLFNAINIWISEWYSSAELENLDIKGLYNPIENEYKPINGSYKLSKFINDGVTNALLLKENPDNVLSPGETASHIIKFYFDPTFGTPNSNAFANQGFSILKFVGNFTQEKVITE